MIENQGGNSQSTIRAFSELCTNNKQILKRNQICSFAEAKIGNEVPKLTLNDQRYELTGTGLRLSITKSSARVIINRVNFRQSSFSISSDCLIAMLTRTELIDPSISTRSFSFRLIITGFSSSSLEVRTSISGLL